MIGQFKGSAIGAPIVVSTESAPVETNVITDAVTKLALPVDYVLADDPRNRLGSRRIGSSALMRSIFRE